MNPLNPGLLSAYNSLTDKHLAGYFSNTRIRRHLQRAGLITRSGRIVPDKEYRHKLIQRTHQRHVRECLAQAIFHKVLEMERLHQIEIKRKLEEFARRERVHKIKLERSRRYEEDIIRILSPRPPTGARGVRKQHSGPEGEHSESSESLGSSRPNTAPGKMQRPVRLKPIHSNSTTATLRRSSPYRLLKSANDNEQLLISTESRRRLTTKETTSGISPYCLPVINNFVTPVPPATKRKERAVKVTPSGTLRGRRLRPTTATSVADIVEDRPVLRSSVHQSRVSVNMVYFGKTVHLSHDMIDMRDEVKVFQQHCGGENLCVYKGKLREGESFQFVSKRHRGFPFSLTFFLNGIQVERLSSCCEFKHRKGSRLGGRHGHFGLSCVEGASPCYKCIIAMGLDKKPTPPPKRVIEEGGSDESFSSPKDAAEMETGRTGEDTSSHSDCETRRGLIREEKAKEDKARDDYEEDFEADDEGPVEDGQEKVKEGDTSEAQDDEKDEDIKSHSGSSCSSSDQEVSDAEDTKDSRKDEEAELREEDSQEVSIAPPDEKDKLSPEEAAAATEGMSGSVRDSDLQRSAGDSTEIDISDTSVPSGRDHSTSEEKETESGGDEGKQDEEERDNFVQDKITESQISCEPKLTDPSTEEQEATDKGHEQDNQVLVPEKSVTFEEQEQTLAEETKSEESAKVGESEVVQVQEDASEPKAEDNRTKTELHEDSVKDETVKKEGEDEKPASEEDDEVKDKPEDMGTAPQPVSEENMGEEHKTSEAQEDGGGECTDTNTAPQDEEQEEKSADAVEADTQPQQAKTSDADVSSVSELVKNTDEKAVSENEEEEVMTVSKTMEMKAEPSEEQEPLSCEEAPVTDTEEKQQGDNTDRPAAPQTGVAADDSSGSVDVSRESVVGITTDIKEDNAKDEDIKDDDVREEDNEEDAAAGASNGGSQQQELEEEQTEKSVEVNGVTEKETSKEQEKQTESDELAQGESGDGKEKNETDIKEEKGNECNADEKIEKEENMVEDTESDEKHTSDQPAEKNAEEEDEVVHEEKASESEKTGGDKFGGSDEDENKNEDDESRAKEATPDQTNEGEEINETKRDLDEVKGDKAEKEEKDDNGSKAEQSEQGDKEPEGENLTISEMTEEPEKNTDNVKTSDENAAESEDVGFNEAAGVDKTTEEMSNNVAQSEDTKKETEGASAKSEKGDIDAENGEISNRTERENQDQAEASDEDKTDVKTAERTEDEEKTEQVLTQEKCTEEPGDDAEGESELQIIGAETNTENKPDTGRGESEDTKQGENCSTADHNNEKGDSYSTKNNNNISDMFDASSADQAQSSTPTGLGATALKLDEFTAKSDKHSHTNENSAADGENGADVEEASKASEEGASVLLKPQATNNEADIVEQSITIAAETPEVLEREDRTDLVTNWVNRHQESKFFKTFVEPFEELEEDASRAQVSSSRKEETTSAEQHRLESPLKMATTPKSEENEQKEENKNREKNNAEAIESDLESEPSKDEPHENGQDKSGLLDKEETEVRDIIMQKTASEESNKDSTKRQREGSKGSLEEDKLDNEENKVQDEPVQSDIFKTEVESIAGTNHSAPSGKPKSDTEEQSEEKTIDHGPDLGEKQTEIKGTKSLVRASKTEEHPERSVSPDGLKDTEETWEKTDGLSGDVTEITDFTTSKSDDGSQEESHNGGMQPRVSDGSASKGLIRNINRTLSKDRLSSFSVDETLFGRSSYPSLNAARTESLH